MKRVYMMIVGLVACITMSAQQYHELWITGSAVPGGAQKLTKVSDNDFKYAGRLLVGEFRISTAKKGVVIIQKQMSDGSIKVEKVIK